MRIAALPIADVFLSRLGPALVLALALLAQAPAARAQDIGVPEQGHGSVTVDYLQVRADERTDEHGNREGIGKVDYQTLHLNLDYGFAERWAVKVELPFGNNRAAGTDHDPRIFSDPHGQHFIDDGRFHAGWKDWTIGLRYRWLTLPVMVTPYLSYRFPSHDYQYYGEAALGLQQSELQLGVSAGGRLPGKWQDAYIAGNASYSCMQEKGGHRVNHSTVELDFGYFFSPRFSAHAGFTQRRSYGGLDFPAALFDADGHFIEDVLFHHDTLRNISFIEVHLGMDLRLDDRYALSAGWGWTAHGENANLVKSAVSVGITRSF